LIPYIDFYLDVCLCLVMVSNLAIM
jgi:hypothetical protein